MEGVVVGQEGIDPDQDVTGAGRGEEVVVGTAGLEAGLKSTGEEVGQNQGQDTGARKKEPVLTRPTLYSRRYLVIIIIVLMNHLRTLNPGMREETRRLQSEREAIEREKAMILAGPGGGGSTGQTRPR